MTARLHPGAQALMQVKHRAARAGNDGGPGDVHRIGVAVERVDEAIKLRQEPLARNDLAVRHGVEIGHGAPERLDVGRGPGT